LPDAPVLLQSVSNALTILELLGEQNEVGIADLARRLGLAKSTVHRLLTTLEAHGFAAQNPATGKYRLGLKAIAVAGRALDLIDFRPLVRPILLNLRDETGETAHLVIRYGDKALFIDKVESQSTIRMTSHLGWQAPLYCTATGKVLLAYLPAEERANLLSQLVFKGYTPNTITDPARLAAELEAIRTRGFSCDNEEIELGLYCIAAPVFGRQGEIVAALSISGPVTRIKNKPALIEKVRLAGQEASRALGFAGPEKF
jgi:DNA-binding IclR family transcriptional regulator